MRSLLITACCVGAFGCAHVVTNEERIDLALTSQSQTNDADALRCRDTSPEIQLARDEKTAKPERLTRYTSVVAQMKATEERFDEEARKDPDLLYGPKAGEWQHKKQVCVDLSAALEHERALLAVDGQSPAVAAEAANAGAVAPAADAGDSDSSKSAAKVSKAKKAKLAKAKKHGKNAQLARADE
jgi:hypothetical protein